MARTAFTTTLAFDEAGLLTAEVEYYFASGVALPIPGFHRFGNGRDFRSQEIDVLGPGEVATAVRTYSKGANSPVQSGDGDFCGSLSWWQEGVPTNAPRLVIDPTTELPPCCPAAPCQPWNSALSPGGATCLQLSNGVFWDLFTDVSFQAIFSDPNSQFGQLTFEQLVALPLCGSYFPTNCVQIVDFDGGSSVGPGVDLVSYDADTDTGIWQIRGNSLQYANELFSFHRNV